MIKTIYIVSQYLRGFLPIYYNYPKELISLISHYITAKIIKENITERRINEGDAVILFIGIKTEKIRKNKNIIAIVILLLLHQNPLKIIPLPMMRPVSITGR